MGEEFILFVSATGVSVVLRHLRGERERSAVDEAKDRAAWPTSDAVRLVALAFAGPTVVLGWYLASHAQTSPSGGFQGGVVLATGFVLIYLAGQYLVFERVSPVDITDAVEAVGAGGFACIGLTAVALGLPYLSNFLPLGQHARRRRLLRDHRADQLLRRHRGGRRVRAHRERTAGADAPDPARGPVMQIFPFIVVAWILAVGLYGIVTSRHLIHLIVCLIIVQSSTYVLLLAVGYVTGAVAPYFYDIPVHTPAVDPVVQALALTDVVVEAAVTALLLSFAIQAHKRFGTLDPQELAELKG